MASINISHHFTMPVDALKSQLDTLATEMASKYQLQCQWKSDQCLTFKRSGANGKIIVEGNELLITMTLGFVMGAFKSVIEKDTRKFLDEHIR